MTGNLQVDGNLAIGNSAGSVAFDGDLALSGSGTYLFELMGGGASADLPDVNGTPNLLGSTLTLPQLAGGLYTLNDKFTWFACNTLGPGTFNGLLDGARFTQAGGLWEINYDDTAPGLNGGLGANDVTISAVPEPATAFLGVLGLLAILRRRRWKLLPRAADEMGVNHLAGCFLFHEIAGSGGGEALEARDRDSRTSDRGGLANKEIADRLNISVEAVRVHLRRVY